MQIQVFRIKGFTAEEFGEKQHTPVLASHLGRLNAASIEIDQRWRLLRPSIERSSGWDEILKSSTFVPLTILRGILSTVIPSFYLSLYMSLYFVSFKTISRFQHEILKYTPGVNVL